MTAAVSLAEDIKCRPRSTKVFLSVQAGRGLAAASVVLFHVSEIIRLAKYWHSDLYHRIFLFGSYGVYFFFVLSGFIIMHRHYDDIGKKALARSYIFKRVIRVYPPYWIASTILLILSLTMNTSASPVAKSSFAIIESYALFGRDAISILPVGWTLFHETLFYSIFGILIFDKKAGIVALLIWFISCSMFSLQSFYWFSYINLLFLSGMGASWFISHKTIYFPWILGIGGMMLFLVGTWLTPNEFYLFMIYGVSCIMVLVGGIQLERSDAIRIPGALTLLGDASYSIYLVHFAVISAGAKILVMINMGVLAAGPSLFAIGIGGGIVFHFLVEKPIAGALRRN